MKKPVHPDTARLNKLERIEKQIRGARWFFSQKGIVIAAKKQCETVQYFTSLRDAIDATPDPVRKNQAEQAAAASVLLNSAINLRKQVTK
jgi:hypothetical protein